MMAPSHFDTDNYALGPTELKALPHWVSWRLEARDGGKPTKVPYDVDGRRASTTNPATWSTYEDTQEAFARFGGAGLGFVFAADDDLLGIDLDHVRDPATGTVKHWAGNGTIVLTPRHN